MHVQTVLFPEGEDPDSFARSNSQKELTDFLQEEKHNFLRFKAELLLSDTHGDPLAKAKAAREMVQSIALIPDELERTAYIQETARMLDMEERILFSELGQIRAGKLEKENQQRKREERGLKQDEVMKVVEQAAPQLEDDILFVQERALTGLLLNHGETSFNFSPDFDDTNYEEEPSETVEEESICEYILTELLHDELDFEHPQLRSILHHFIKVFNEEERIAKAEEFLRGENPDRMHLVVDLISDEPELHDWKRKRIYPPDKDAYLRNYTIESVLRFKEKKTGKLIAKIQDDLKSGKNLNPDALATAQQLTKLKIEINKRLNRIL
jgi:DNA primase